MPAKLLCYLFFQLICHPGKAQDTLLWKQGYLLSWNDFKGDPDIRSGYLALSSAGISYHLYYNRNSVELNAEAFFVKSRSWKKPSADSSLLQHEQGHFDITEIYRRKLVETAKDIPANVLNKAGWLNEKADIIIGQKNAFQLQYDAETKNGTDKKMQAQWLDKIRALLIKIPF